MTIPDTISQAVFEALKDAPLLPRDSGAVALVNQYAATLDANPDDVRVLADLGPKLLAALVALGMAPVGRGVKDGGGTSAPVVNKLDELRARREARANGA